MQAKTATLSTFVFILSASTMRMTLPRAKHAQIACSYALIHLILKNKPSPNRRFPKRNSKNPNLNPTNAETINRGAIVFAEHQPATVLLTYALNKRATAKNCTPVLPPKTKCRLVGHPKFLRLNLRTITLWMSSRIGTCSFRMMQDGQNL